MKKKYFTIIFVLTIICVLIAGAGYGTWNSLDPEKTCANCHEVRPTFERWKTSAHAKVSCFDCHGTALSNGFHSLKEKLGMVFTHVSGTKENSDVKLTEDQLIDVMDRCIKCHSNEGAKWKGGAHSSKYSNIFEDRKHNIMEKPYWDCMRCHGMFYGGNIHTLMNLESDKPEDWKIRDSKQAAKPSIPCMACHQIHRMGETYGEFKSAYESKMPFKPQPKTAFYVRTQRTHTNTEDLFKLEMFLNGEKVKASKDPNNLLCIQCHSPNWRHEAGTQDDKTPTGVHEGISCIACHDPHSNSAKNSCVKCHTDSVKDGKCKVDVLNAETTFKSATSKNDIHKITCLSCHEAKK